MTTSPCADILRLARTSGWVWEIAEDKFHLAKNFLGMFNLPPESEGDFRNALLERVDPEDHLLAHQWLWPLLQSEKDTEVEFNVGNGNGGLLRVRAWVRVERDASGRPARVIAAVQDVTIERERQRQAELEARRIYDADKVITLNSLLAGAAHEINNPSGLILLGAQLLKDAWQSVIPILEQHCAEHGDFTVADFPYENIRDEFPKVANDILSAASRIRRLVGDLREYAKPVSPGTLRLFSLNDAVEKACQELQERLDASTACLTLELSEGLPEIWADPVRITNAIVRVLQNACESLRDRNQGICVATSHLPGQSIVRLEVRDEGVGIAEEDIPFVTDPFFSTKRSSGRSGLGLAIASSVLREFGGSLQINSSIEEGTTAVIVLPANEKAHIIGGTA